MVVKKKYVGEEIYWQCKNMYAIGEMWVDLIESLCWCHSRWAENGEDKLRVQQMC
jgi:hypothetical protein